MDASLADHRIIYEGGEISERGVGLILDKDMR